MDREDLNYGHTDPAVDVKLLKKRLLGVEDLLTEQHRTRLRDLELRAKHLERDFAEHKEKFVEQFNKMSVRVGKLEEPLT